jgi:hypothetical protein
MSDLDARGTPHDRLIERLVADLAPAQALWSPLLRAALWLGAAAIIAIGIAPFSDLGAVGRRLMAVPDMWLAFLGSALAAAFAAIAAFELALPDRKDAWALLPIPPLLLWIFASGAGCLRTWLLPETHIAPLEEAKDCLFFIVGFSAPLSGIMIYMLKRAHPLRPNLVGVVGGLAVAAATNVLLVLRHPFDAAATDLLVHLVAVLIVVGLNLVAAKKFFAERFEWSPRQS